MFSPGVYCNMSVVFQVLMIRIEICPDICFPIVNLLTYPLVNLSVQIWFGRSNVKVGWKMSDD